MGLRGRQAVGCPGAPVVARIGSFAVETPETWFLGCLVLFIFFLPLYMVSRAG